MSGYTDDLETYLELCRYYKMEPQRDESGAHDLYGHGRDLWQRHRNEQIAKTLSQKPEPVPFAERCLSRADSAQCLLKANHDGPHRFPRFE